MHLFLTVLVFVAVWAFPWLWRVGATPQLRVWASHCGGFSFVEHGL